MAHLIRIVMILALFATCADGPARARSASAIPAPRRIVSLNLCADQYLVALADRDQIASLSRYARDPELSFFATRARTFPVLATSVEQVLVLRPDLLIGVPFRQRDALSPLAARGVPMIDLPPANGLADIERTIAMIAVAVGHPERGRALIADIRAKLAAIGTESGRSGAPGRGRVAAYYQRRGYLTGAGTLVDEIFRRVGLVNLATRLSRPALTRLSIEEMAMGRPDFLVLETGSAKVVDQGTAMLRHPLLDALGKLYLPQALTVCAGPSYPAAVAALSASLRAADRRDRAPVN